MQTGSTRRAHPLPALCILLLTLALTGGRLHAETAAPPSLGFKVLAQYPHDTNSFTQGLELDDGALYESSGLYRRSFITRTQLPPAGSAKTTASPADARRQLPERDFGEGLTVWDDRIYVVTWRERRGLVFERTTLAPVSEFEIGGEGWGLTHDETHLILSDGSPVLRFLDRQSFAVAKTLTVRSGGKPLSQLNELEWVGARDGRPARLLANVWQTDELVVIDPATGDVTGRIDLGRLYPHGMRSPRADVMNGIAWDSRDDTLLVTGKFWPQLYRLQLSQPLP